MASANTSLLKRLKSTYKNARRPAAMKKWLPLALVLVVATGSFFFSWYGDTSKPIGAAGWADQELYRDSSDRLAAGNLPTENQLHFTIGYPLLGVIARLVPLVDPFMVVSLLLLLGSLGLCFLAARQLLGLRWALLFTLLLLFWDGVSRSFNYASELFAVPWNNQVLFFAMAFYFWLFVTRAGKPVRRRLLISIGLVGGLTFLTREETILFVLPATAAFLYITSSNWRRYAAVFLVIVGCFLPQALIKQQVTGSAFASTHDDSYGQTLGEKYFQPKQFYRNVWETVIDSDRFDEPNPSRRALLQAAPWLWLSPFGLLVILISKRYNRGLKLFVAGSLFLMVFYLSGANMSAQKLKFHCLRYIAPGFIALNLGTVITLKESLELVKKRRKAVG